MNAEEFWNLPRSAAPTKVFLELAPALPVRLPAATLQQGVVIEVRGAGGGVWSGRLVDGRLQTQEGASADPICRVVLERGTLRELVAGSLRDRGLQIMEKLGRPRAAPDFSRLPVRDDRARALTGLQGSVALDIVDRRFGETLRVVFTFGAGPAAFETASATVTVDADEAVTWIAGRIDPRVILKSGRLRVDGDLSLLTRALGLLLEP